MYTILRSLLFLLSAETAHKFSFKSLKFFLNISFIKKLIGYIYSVDDPSLETELFGLKFKNPVGIAAGFDKNGELINELEALGFGFIEVGTVTPKSQPGNEKPRLFRLQADNAIINRMGFNNEGVKALVQHLKKHNKNLIIGGNIGKNKVTPNEKAFDDYAICFEELFPYVDYFVVNVSSPNTPNLRDLQEKEPLTQLLNGLQALNAKKGSPKPILLKIAPDLTKEQLDDIVDITRDTKIAGLIATNTTVSRNGLRTNWKKVNAIGAGGLSGKPVAQKSTEVIRYLSSKLNGEVPIIGVGGILTAQDAIEKMEAGASLVQVYTGFVYEGPALVKQINKAILKYKSGGER